MPPQRITAPPDATLGARESPGMHHAAATNFVEQQQVTAGRRCTTCLPTTMRSFKSLTGPVLEEQNQRDTFKGLEVDP